jgi:predicted nucleotidyltransferase
LVKAGILKEEKVGNNVIYSVADNIFALNTLGFFAEHKAHDTSHLPHKSIQKIAAKIRSPFYSLLITGSYAKAKQKATSDVDLVILCESKSSSAAILSQIKLESELAIPEIHLQIFTWEDFYIMLTNNEENFGKGVARNNLIITGGKPYYAVLLEAIKHGFAG